ncbi:hypothetical protein [Enterovirga aerilata]|uniref:Uncharacterized protein n=1 Tax=Enterovirga aerilata TaxID=2730920 RepID=A0A849HX19_9HYPH|nr:hypothetical protein [Enterovirga sp. DB1703]NNM72086.1 hypothetical protein [Enterovirga sp. DB1703]
MHASFIGSLSPRFFTLGPVEPLSHSMRSRSNVPLNLSTYGLSSGCFGRGLEADADAGERRGHLPADELLGVVPPDLHGFAVGEPGAVDVGETLCDVRLRLNGVRDAHQRGKEAGALGVHVDAEGIAGGDVVRDGHPDPGKAQTRQLLAKRGLPEHRDQVDLMVVYLDEVEEALGPLQLSDAAEFEIGGAHAFQGRLAAPGVEPGELGADEARAGRLQREALFEVDRLDPSHDQAPELLGAELRKLVDGCPDRQGDLVDHALRRPARMRPDGVAVDEGGGLPVLARRLLDPGQDRPRLPHSRRVQSLGREHRVDAPRDEDGVLGIPGEHLAASAGVVDGGPERPDVAIAQVGLGPDRLVQGPVGEVERRVVPAGQLHAVLSRPTKLPGMQEVEVFGRAQGEGGASLGGLEPERADVVLDQEAVRLAFDEHQVARVQVVRHDVVERRCAEGLLGQVLEDVSHGWPSAAIRGRRGGSGCRGRLVRGDRRRGPRR